MRHLSRVIAVLSVLAAAVVLAACGSSDSESSDVVNGQFELVPGAPAGYESLAGEASLKRTDGSTMASLQVTGLEPKTAYVAHLHTQKCDQADPGGPHFKFDPGGSDEPPNEIHLEFSSDADGSGSAKASSGREVPIGAAGSIVLHEAGDDHLTAAAGGAEGEVVLVHEGHHHGEEGDSEDGTHSAPAKIACAELEGGDATAAADSPTIVVRNGEPVGGVQELEYSAGDQVRFNVKSDVADEIHVHSYDLMQDVPKGGEVSFDFPAEIEGIFEVELEGRKEQIAELRVDP
jgi:Cu-Zn family superoxide dismutase